jgi:hypothetical protein
MKFKPGDVVAAIRRTDYYELPILLIVEVQPETYSTVPIWIHNVDCTSHVGTIRLHTRWYLESEFDEI